MLLLYEKLKLDKNTMAAKNNYKRYQKNNFLKKKTAD